MQMAKLQQKKYEDQEYCGNKHLCNYCDEEQCNEPVKTDEMDWCVTHNCEIDTCPGQKYHLECRWCRDHKCEDRNCIELALRHDDKDMFKFYCEAHSEDEEERQERYY